MKTRDVVDRTIDHELWRRARVVLGRPRAVTLWTCPRCGEETLVWPGVKGAGARCLDRKCGLHYNHFPGIETMVTPDGVPVLDAVSLMLQEGGWGLWESIKTTLLTTSGAGAAIIGKPRPRRGKDADPEDDTERRPSLFDRALEAMA